MSNYIREREARRPIILKGISKGLELSDIANQLGANRRVIRNDIRVMRYKDDPELKNAQNAREKIQTKRTNNTKVHALEENDRFLKLTGMTLQEKSFLNMIDFNKKALKKILKSTDQNSAIMKLPKSIRRTLIHNGIIIKKWQDNKITSHALKYLANK